jgi:hypothetical protein
MFIRIHAGGFQTGRRLQGVVGEDQFGGRLGDLLACRAPQRVSSCTSPNNFKQKKLGVRCYLTRDRRGHYAADATIGAPSFRPFHGADGRRSGGRSHGRRPRRGRPTEAGGPPKLLLVISGVDSGVGRRI